MRRIQRHKRSPRKTLCQQPLPLATAAAGVEDAHRVEAHQLQSLGHAPPHFARQNIGILDAAPEKTPRRVLNTQA